MNPHLFTFGITEGVKFPFDLHQLSLHEWKCRLWEIRGAGSLLAADLLVLRIWRNLHTAPILQRGRLEPVPLLNILTLKSLLPFLLFLRSLRTQPRLPSFRRSPLVRRGTAAHSETQHDAERHHDCSFSVHFTPPASRWGFTRGCSRAILRENQRAIVCAHPPPGPRGILIGLIDKTWPSGVYSARTLSPTL